MTDEITHASSCNCTKCEDAKEALALQEAILSVSYAMKNTGVICTGQPIKGIPCAHSFEHHLQALLDCATDRQSRLEKWATLYNLEHETVVRLQRELTALKQEKVTK